MHVYTLTRFIRFPTFSCTSFPVKALKGKGTHPRFRPSPKAE